MFGLTVPLGGISGTGRAARPTSGGTLSMNHTHGQARLWRTLAGLALAGLFAGACGNSGDDDVASDATTTTADGGSEAGSDELVPLSGVPGVTDEEIRSEEHQSDRQSIIRLSYAVF